MKEAENIYLRQSLAHIKTASMGIKPLMLQNQLGALYDLIDELMLHSDEWRHLHLYDGENRLIYPLVQEKKHHHSFKKIAHEINVGSSTSGRIEVFVDTTKATEALNNTNLLLGEILIGVIVMMLLLLALGINHFVVNPLGKLVNATKALAGGDFSALLPSAIPSELRSLIVSFDFMRKSIASNNEKLVKEKNKAEVASRAKTEFLANINHELRTPMNGVLGAAQLLNESKENYSEEQRKLLDIVLKSGKLMVSIINDIIDYSKIDADKLELEMIPIDLFDEIKAVRELFADEAKNKEISLSLNIESNVPRYLYSDPVRLSQVLINLVSNAIKFTDSGEIKIEVKRGVEKNTLFVRVVDTGIGINKNNLEKIFSPFIQADTTTTRTYGGSGLGLAIVRNLIQLMGGEIDVASEEGKGSSFHFFIPLREASEEDYLREHEGSASLSTEHHDNEKNKLNILVVEDNKTNQLVLTQIIEKKGHSVSIAGNGEIALGKIKSEKFDMVFMDWMMPVMDGVEATEKIRELGGEYSLLPIIGITANTTSNDLKKCLARGMNQCLTKPIRKDEIFAILEQRQKEKDTEK